MENRLLKEMREKEETVIKPIFRFVLILFAIIPLLIINGCITKFIPEETADKNLIVVEGVITDQPGPHTIKISTSMPLGIRSSASPVTGCNVYITDDTGNSIPLSETSDGMYSTSPEIRGVVGRSYVLHINSGPGHQNLSYISSPALLKPVPPIDSVYYEKVIVSKDGLGFITGEGCQIYLDSHDPANSCRFYRFEYVETWEFRLPYQVINNRCWVSNNSADINIKNTTSLSDDKITRFPVNYITNESDRLNMRYSILVNQYSLSEGEYEYWDKLRNTVEEVGSLYDIIPASIPSNIKCIEKPEENVLGYFSVSSVKSKRMFIHDQFRGMVNLYIGCENKVVGYNDPIPNLNSVVWLIIDHPEPPPGYKVLTYYKGCADCTARGTTTRPDFWPEDN